MTYARSIGDLSDFQRGQNVSARLAGATVTETTQLLGISRGTVSKVMKAYEKEGKLVLQSINQVAVSVCLKGTEEH